MREESIFGVSGNSRQTLRIAGRAAIFYLSRQRQNAQEPQPSYLFFPRVGSYVSHSFLDTRYISLCHLRWQNLSDLSRVLRLALLSHAYSSTSVCDSCKVAVDFLPFKTYVFLCKRDMIDWQKNVQWLWALVMQRPLIFVRWKDMPIYKSVTNGEDRDPADKQAVGERCDGRQWSQCRRCLWGERGPWLGQRESEENGEQQGNPISSIVDLIPMHTF